MKNKKHMIPYSRTVSLSTRKIVQRCKQNCL